MGHFRFRRSIGGRFFRLNVSKSGFSVTSGVPGAHLNVPLVSTRKRKIMSTFGLPGTGLSYRQEIGSSYRGVPKDDVGPIKYIIVGIIVLAIISWYMGGQ